MASAEFKFYYFHNFIYSTILFYFLNLKYIFLFEKSRKVIRYKLPNDIIYLEKLLYIFRQELK